MNSANLASKTLATLSAAALESVTCFLLYGTLPINGPKAEPIAGNHSELANDNHLII